MDVSTLTVGDSFILDGVEGIHLHVIVAEIQPGKDGLVMLVYLSSAESYRDETTIVEQGEHPFITKKSWVRYRNTKIMQRASLDGKIQKYYGKVSPQFLDKIQKGLLKSKFTSGECKRCFKEWTEERLINQMH